MSPHGRPGGAHRGTLRPAAGGGTAATARPQPSRVAASTAAASTATAKPDLDGAWVHGPGRGPSSLRMGLIRRASCRPSGDRRKGSGGRPGREHTRFAPARPRPPGTRLEWWRLRLLPFLPASRPVLPPGCGA